MIGGAQADDKPRRKHRLTHGNLAPPNRLGLPRNRSPLHQIVQMGRRFNPWFPLGEKRCESPG